MKTIESEITSHADLSTIGAMRWYSCARELRNEYIEIARQQGVEKAVVAINVDADPNLTDEEHDAWIE